MSEKENLKKLKKKIDYFSHMRVNYSKETDIIFEKLVQGKYVTNFEYFLLLCDDQIKIETYQVIDEQSREVGKSITKDDLEFLIAMGFSDSPYLYNFVLKQFGFFKPKRKEKRLTLSSKKYH